MALNENMTTRELLASLETEYAELGQVISVLRARLGTSANGHAKTSIIEAEPTQQNQAYNFDGMSRAQAALAVLKKEKRPMSTKELAEILDQNGIVMSGKHAAVSLNTALTRSGTINKIKNGSTVLWKLSDAQPKAQHASSLLRNIDAKRANQVAGRRGSELTCGNVAEATLKKAESALHINQIMQAVNAAGLFPSRATLSSVLLKDSRRRFKNEGNNTFTLREPEGKGATS
jgi:hypothetical protein